MLELPEKYKKSFDAQAIPETRAFVFSESHPQATVKYSQGEDHQTSWHTSAALLILLSGSRLWDVFLCIYIIYIMN